MDDNEALRRWLLKACALESSIDCIAHKVEAGMSLPDAVRECDVLFGGVGSVRVAADQTQFPPCRPSDGQPGAECGQS